ncbi:MAG: PH domain-containing protein [Chitinophagaceae bacterium]
MEFINEQLTVKELPKVEDVNLQPLQSRYLDSLLIQYGIIALIILAGLGAAIIFVPLMRTTFWLLSCLLIWLLIFLPGWWLEVRSFHYKGYAIRDKDVIFRSGWIVQQTTGCPFNRIQHCSVSSGPIDRRYGLATLRIYTASSDGDLAIPGLLEEDAFAIKAFITKKIVTDE